MGRPRPRWRCSGLAVDFSCSTAVLGEGPSRRIERRESLSTNASDAHSCTSSVPSGRPAETHAALSHCLVRTASGAAELTTGCNGRLSRRLVGSIAHYLKTCSPYVRRASWRNMWPLWRSLLVLACRSSHLLPSCAADSNTTIPQLDCSAAFAVLHEGPHVHHPLPLSRFLHVMLTYHGNHARILAQRCGPSSTQRTFCRVPSTRPRCRTWPM